MEFLRVSTSLHTRLTAETNLADGELLQVKENKKEFLKLRDRKGIPVIIKRDGQHFTPE
jgi:hypothetical protein